VWVDAASVLGLGSADTLSTGREHIWIVVTAWSSIEVVVTLTLLHNSWVLVVWSHSTACPVERYHTRTVGGVGILPAAQVLDSGLNSDVGRVESCHKEVV